ncbi:MAG TPA: lytic transglycosylase domain-containing protein [Candidatus Krumholzibacteria bacterium]
MHRVVPGVCVAAAVVALGLCVPALSKTTSTLPPGNPDESVLARARLLASHGEPGLALKTLRAHDFKRDADAWSLTASLLVETGNPAAAESLLAATNPAAPGDHGFAGQLVRARLLLDAKRYAGALSVIASMDTASTSPYAGYRDLVAARALVAEGDRAAALGVVEKARAHAPAAIRNEFESMRIGLYRALDRPQDALAAAVEAAGDGGDAAANRRVLEIRFDLALDADQLPVALAAARELFDNHARSAEARACALRLAELRDAGRIDTDLLLACASVLQSRGQRDALRTVLRGLDKRALTDHERESHRLLWGEYHYLGGDYSRAIALARPSYGDPSLRRRSVLLMARSYKKVGRTADAATTYEAYARAFPNDAIAAEALYTASSLRRQIGEEKDADRLLDELRHAYPSTFHGWAASVARAKALDASGAHADAAAIYDQWLTRSRRTDEAALFYSSRLKRSDGDPQGGDALLAELRAVNPYSIYAQPDLLSSAKRGAPAAGPLDSWLAGADQKRADAFDRVQSRVRATGASSPQARLAIDRARFFLAAGLRDWAEGELDVARREAADGSVESMALARLFDEHAMPWRSVRLYERNRAAIPWKERRGSEDDFRYLTHPVPYPVQVMAAAQREGISPDVIYGMMREESCFDTDVISRAGAVGLMQLMPDTARRIARKLDLAPGSGDRLGDPVVNVSIGSWYAADLLREGDGSVVWMLAAYNAGPGAARRWIDPGVSGDAAIDAMEAIEFKETRGYVKRVVESANVYRTLYFDGGFLPATPAR